MRTLTFALVAFAVVLTISTSANGALIPLSQQEPDIQSSFLYANYTYNAGVDNDLTVDGFASILVLVEGGTEHQIEHPTELNTLGLYNLSAKIDDSGNLVSGDLTVIGCAPSLGYTSGTILSGDLNNFGYSSASDLLEFEFLVTGGDAAGDYGGNGSTGGVILLLASDMFAFNNDFADDFEINWDNDEIYNGSGFNGNSQADTFVPEPATIGLMAIGLGLIARKRRS